MGIRLGRVAVALGVGLVTYFTLLTLGVEGLHHYRVWKADGVWCALGNDKDGWQRGYGEEDCPELHP